MTSTPTSTTALLPQRDRNEGLSISTKLLIIAAVAIAGLTYSTCSLRNYNISLRDYTKQVTAELVRLEKSNKSYEAAKEECNKKYEELTTERDSLKTRFESCDNELKLCNASEGDLEEKLANCQGRRSARRTTPNPPTRTRTPISQSVPLPYSSMPARPDIRTDIAGNVQVNGKYPDYYADDLFNPLRQTNSEFGKLVGLNFIKPCQDGTLTGTALYRFVVHENRIYTLPSASQNSLRSTTITAGIQAGISYIAILSALDRQVVPLGTRNGIYNINLKCEDNSTGGLQ